MLLLLLLLWVDVLKNDMRKNIYIYMYNEKRDEKEESLIAGYTAWCHIGTPPTPALHISTKIGTHIYTYIGRKRERESV
jgi:hypothetical protein